MRRLSLQWHITLMTALLLCLICVLMNLLIGYSGMRYMALIGDGISAYSDIDKDGPLSFDPASEGFDDELTIVVSDAQESFGATSWCITAAVTLLGGNPTGEAHTKHLLSKLIEVHLSVCFVIDQSYAPFTCEPLFTAAEAAATPQVILLHSATKR